MLFYALEDYSRTVRSSRPDNTPGTHEEISKEDGGAPRERLLSADAERVVEGP